MEILIILVKKCQKKGMDRKVGIKKTTTKSVDTLIIWEVFYILWVGIAPKLLCWPIVQNLIKRCKGLALFLQLIFSKPQLNYNSTQSNITLMGLDMKMTLHTTPPGRQILWEPGNQVPTKCISSSEFFGRIHALPRIDKFNQRV